MKEVKVPTPECKVVDPDQKVWCAYDIKGCEVVHPPPASLPCPCGQEAVPTAGDVVYAHRPDLADKKFYVCAACSRRVGTHAASGFPLGTPADAVTRSARERAHAAFDPLWRNGGRFPKRRLAYEWLATQMGIQGEVHIGNMTAEQADDVVRICELSSQET